MSSKLLDLLLVIIKLVVEELLQDLAERADLLFREVGLELVRAPELLVELVLCLLQQQGLTGRLCVLDHIENGLDSKIY